MLVQAPLRESLTIPSSTLSIERVLFSYRSFISVIPRPTFAVTDNTSKDNALWLITVPKQQKNNSDNPSPKRLNAFV